VKQLSNSNQSKKLDKIKLFFELFLQEKKGGGLALKRMGWDAQKTTSLIPSNDENISCF
jgi:hypothetical protein